MDQLQFFRQLAKRRSPATLAIHAFHKRSINGSYGKVLQAASEAGEDWGKKGFNGGNSSARK